MNTEFCLVQREGPLTVVTLNRPDVLNALHYEADLELDAVWREFAQDPEQWVAILTGAGERAFSAGNDLKAHARAGRRRMPPSGFGGLTGRFDLNKPVIAAVNGAAVGGGFEMALACDLVIAAESAYFALPEVRVGLAAMAGGTAFLPRAIGWQQSMSILLTGRRVSADEGLRLGFVNAVAKECSALVEAKRWAAQLLECSPMSLQATKQLASRSTYSSHFQEVFKDPGCCSAVRDLRASADYREGPAAFNEKRKPNWKAETFS